MWYTTFVVISRVYLTALPATSRTPGSTKKSGKSNHCHTSAISGCTVSPVSR
jgi:hypothetical protein